MISSEIKDTLKELIRSSTCHGIPSAFRTKRSSLRVMWILLFIGCAAYCSYLINDSIMSYLEYDVVTRIDLIYENPARFPAITFCNLNKKFTKYNLNETLIDCGFNRSECLTSEFSWFFDPNNGYCFMFNSGKNQLNENILVKNSTKAGYSYGLNLKIYADSEDKSINAPLSQGFNIFVHNSSISPNTNFGTSIPIGLATRVTIKREFSQKLGEPYNKCWLESTLFDSNIFREMLRLNITYSQKKCFDLLAFQQIGKHCDCETDLKHIHQNCAQKNIECLSSVHFRFFDNNNYEILSKQCPFDCSTIDYTTKTSFSDINYYDFFTKINQSLTFKPKYGNETISYESLKRTVVDVSIYYEDLSYTLIKQLPKSEPFDLVSNCGGLLGLFIGTSFLSFAELIEMFLEIIFFYLERKIKPCLKLLNV